MKILLTIPPLNEIGGVAEFFLSVLPFLKKNKKYDITYLEIGSSSNKWHKRIMDQISFYKKISKNKFDLIHLNPSLTLRSFLRDGLLIYLAKKKKLRVLIFMHGWDERFEPALKKKYWWIFKRTFLKADGFIVLGTIFKNKLISMGITAPVFMLTTSIKVSNIKNFSIKKKTERLKKATKINILFLARLEKRKGCLETVKAVNILLKRGFDVSLSIAGDGVAMPEIKEYIKDSNLGTDRVALLGYVKGEQKNKVYNSHHVYCFPTYSGEGMPTTVLEAMCFGMPVVTRPNGGLKDFFQNQKMGYITESKDPETIANLLEKLITNKEKMIEIALYNHKYAMENFLGDKVAEKLANVYNSIYNKTN